MDIYNNGKKIKLASERKELTNSDDLDFVADGEYIIKGSLPKNSPGAYGLLTVTRVDYNNIYQYFTNFNGYYIRCVHSFHGTDNVYKWYQLLDFNK